MILNFTLVLPKHLNCGQIMGLRLFILPAVGLAKRCAQGRETYDKQVRAREGDIRQISKARRPSQPLKTGFAETSELWAGYGATITLLAQFLGRLWNHRGTNRIRSRKMSTCQISEILRATREGTYDYPLRPANPRSLEKERRLRVWDAKNFFEVL